MSNSREKILGNIQAGLEEALLPNSMPERPHIDYPKTDGDLGLFVAELQKLSAEVVRFETHEEAVRSLIQLFRERNWPKTLIWQSLLERDPDLKESLETAEIEAVTEDALDDLARIPVGVTGVHAAIADTGTLVLQNNAGQPSFVSLLPDVHIVFVHADELYPNLHAFLESSEDIGAEISKTNNLVFISGPSRTADIEQTLTLGVHGPRELIIILIEQTYQNGT